MAKAKTPLLSFGASKSIGKEITFRKGRRKYHVQKHFKPYDRKTADQQSIRTAMHELQSEWKNLTDTQQEAWENNAKERYRGKQSGYSLFIKENFTKYHNTGTFDSWPNWNLKLKLTTGEKLILTTGEQLVVNLGD